MGKPLEIRDGALMPGRENKEWFGRCPGTQPPPRVKLRIVERAGFKCHDCFRAFGEKLKPEFDHRPALIKGGENRESKIFAVCFECHAKKTKKDVRDKAITAKKMKDIFLKKPKSSFQNSRGGKWKTTISQGTKLRAEWVKE